MPFFILLGLLLLFGSAIASLAVPGFLLYGIGYCFCKFKGFRTACGLILAMAAIAMVIIGLWKVVQNWSQEAEEKVTQTKEAQQVVLQSNIEMMKEARIAYRNKDLEQSERLFTSVAFGSSETIGPDDHAIALNNLGVIYQDKQQTSRALFSYTKSIRLLEVLHDQRYDNILYDVHRNKASVLRLINKFKDASEEEEIAMSIHSKHKHNE